MDPDAIWKCLFDALIDLRKDPENKDTRAHVVDCLNQLSTWIYRKGFAPDVLKHLFDTMEQIEAQLADEEGRARKGDF